MTKRLLRILLSVVLILVLATIILSIRSRTDIFISAADGRRREITYWGPLQTNDHIIETRFSRSSSHCNLDAWDSNDWRIMSRVYKGGGPYTQFQQTQSLSSLEVLAMAWEAENVAPANRCEDAKKAITLVRQNKRFGIKIAHGGGIEFVFPDSNSSTDSDNNLEAKQGVK